MCNWNDWCLAPIIIILRTKNAIETTLTYHPDVQHDHKEIQPLDNEIFSRLLENSLLLYKIFLWSFQGKILKIKNEMDCWCWERFLGLKGVKDGFIHVIITGCDFRWSEKYSLTETNGWQKIKIISSKISNPFINVSIIAELFVMVLSPKSLPWQ